MIVDYEVIGERYSEQLSQTVPLLNVPMMSDERYSQLAKQQAVKHYIAYNGHEPENEKEAFQWQREWAAQMIKD